MEEEHDKAELTGAADMEVEAMSCTGGGARSSIRGKQGGAVGQCHAKTRGSHAAVLPEVADVLGRWGTADAEKLDPRMGTNTESRCGKGEEGNLVIVQF